MWTLVIALKCALLYYYPTSISYKYAWKYAQKCTEQLFHKKEIEIKSLL